MKKNKHTNSASKASGDSDLLGLESDFYTGSVSHEQPLYQERHHSSHSSVHKTSRHQAVAGRRKKTVDPREKMALVAILKSTIMILLLIMAFLLLWKGINIYEESAFIKIQSAEEVSPVLRDVALVEGLNIENQDSQEMFAERIETWKEADRLIRSADGLLKRNNFDQAIERCQDALRLDPSHMGALEHLGVLYFEKGMYVEAINSYIRLLNGDPSRNDFQEKLIRALDAHEDSDAVAYMSHWYLEQNAYNENVQRYLANALFAQGEYAESALAYDRFLKDQPMNIEALEKQAEAYMHIEEYQKALGSLEKLRERNYREAKYYHDIIICHAQLANSVETVQTLGKAAHLFGQNVVMGWVQDPKLDPVRTDRTFQAFADRVGGEEFRKWLEKVAMTMDSEPQEGVDLQLTQPTDERLNEDLLNRN